MTFVLTLKCFYTLLLLVTQTRIYRLQKNKKQKKKIIKIQDYFPNAVRQNIKDIKLISSSLKEYFNLNMKYLCNKEIIYNN